jgi:hypothetical protein
MHAPSKGIGRNLDSEGELDADVDVTGHLDDLGELDGLLGGGLEVLDGEDLEAGLVDLWVEKRLACCAGFGGNYVEKMEGRTSL